MAIMKSTTLLFTALALFSSTHAAPAHDHSDHDHVSYIQRSGNANKDWYQNPETPSAKLFKRAPNGAPGSPEWQASYPAPGATPPTSGIPQAWLDRLYQVTNSSSFPKFGPSLLNGGYPTYADGTKGSDPEICSYTYQCISSEDLAGAPQGVVGLNFDDGPTTFSPTLYDFIEKNNISATHFMIGGNIYYNPAIFSRAEQDGGHIAGHTWSHPYMTTLTNEQIVAELGWTSQIIADMSGGKVPAFWRPPYGDADNRVRYIASQVFGMRTVPWTIDRDTGDWAIGSNPQYTHDSVVNTMTGWLTDPARQGYIGLEHEASQADVDVFMAIYPVMLANNWTVLNIAEANNMWYYANAENDTSPIVGPTGIVQTAAPGALTTYLPTKFTNATSTIAANSTSMAVSTSSMSVSSSTASSSAITSSMRTGAASSSGVSTVAPSVVSAVASPAVTTGAAMHLAPATGIIGALVAIGLAFLA